MFKLKLNKLYVTYTVDKEAKKLNLQSHSLKKQNITIKVRYSAEE